ncbi:MAG TPA: PP2C family protein-serine/threonine phosphatase [Bryobacteraceae bacterium]|nr:PP2C family protein-serine/threonine phosphatase [Bryobacteraceae bacterium]
MASREKVAGYFWVKVSIGLGLILGLLLLVQTVGTYRYVSRGMVRQEAQAEADRKVTGINRLLRNTTREEADYKTAIDEILRDSPQTVAWIRILNSDGKTIASVGNPSEAPRWTAESLRNEMVQRGQQHQDVRQTSGGEVLLSVSPMGRGGFGRNGRGGPPPDQMRGQGPGIQSAPPPFAVVPERPQEPLEPPRPAGASGGFQPRGPGRGPGPLVETAIYLKGISVSFAPLLIPLAVGSTAAIALLAAVVLIGLRFPSYISGKQYEEELALARRVQSDLFPRDGVPTSNLEFAARFIPSRQVGGDLYDIFETDDRGVAIVLGDVSGKGLSAALLMGVVQGAVRTSSDTGLSTHHEYAADRLNHLLCMKTARERFVSLFWCYLNPEGNRLSYINAGHLPAVLVRERFGRADVWRLEQGGGPVLGVLPGARYRQAEVDIEPGDLLVIFSDGVSEATNAEGAEFGEDGIVESVKRVWKNSAAGVCDGILGDVRKFLGDMPPHDDQTLLVVRLQQVAKPEGEVRPRDAEATLAR